MLADMPQDDFEVEISALSAGEGAEARRFIPWPLERLLPSARLWHWLLAAGAVVLALLVVLSMVFAPAASAPVTTIALPAAPSSPLNGNSSQTTLGVPPHYCLTAPTPRLMLPDIGPVIGGGPVWVAGFDGLQATLHISNTDPALSTRYGWIAEVLWKVGPDFSGTVMVHGRNLTTRVPLWLRIPYQAASPLLLLDPRAPSAVSSQGKGWAAWQGEIYIPMSGCYSLEAVWPGGSWHITFAAGKGAMQIIPPNRQCRGQEAACIPLGP